MTSAADRLKALNRQDLAWAARQKAGKRKGKTLRKPPRAQFPVSAEREYVRRILDFPKAMQHEVNYYLIPQLQRLLAEAESVRPTADGITLDRYDFAEQVRNLMGLIRSNYDGLFTETAIAAFVARIADAVQRQNGRELGKVFRSVLGVDVIGSEPWLASEMQAFVTANVSLIKTLPERFFPAIEQQVYAAARQGISYQVLKKEIQKKYQNSNFQAERIARDQIGKFNGQLTQLRQTQAGIGKYIWRTVRDSRVRDEHAAREGKEFSWAAPPDDGHPGEAIQCRCYAEPMLDGLLEF